MAVTCLFKNALSRSAGHAICSPAESVENKDVTPSLGWTVICFILNIDLKMSVEYNLDGLYC